MTSEKDNSIALTLDRGLAVLECVLAGATTLDEVVARTGLSRSAAHRLLTTLTRREYLRQVPGSGWTVGFKMIELAGLVHDRVDPAGLLQKAVDELAADVEDSVHIGVLRGRELQYVAKGQGSRTIQMISRVGLRLPAQNTALGRVLWAFNDIDEAVAGFDRNLIQTQRSVRTAKAFRAILQEVRTHGFAVDDEESTLGLTCVAVPLGDQRPLRAALSVSAPSAYMTPDRIEDLVRRLTAAAPGIARRFSAMRELGE